VNPNPETYLETITALGPDAVYALGATTPETTERSFVERWNGTAWHRVATHDPAAIDTSVFYGSAAASAGDQARVWGFGFTETGSDPDQSLIQQSCP
jgi:hypothetical protein